MKRFWIVVKAKFNKWLGRIEDPSETLEYGYQKQVELLQNVKKGIADVVTSKKRLELQRAKLQQQGGKLEGQARMALQQGREDLARVALERKQQAETQSESLDSQISELENQQEQLIRNEQKLRDRIEAFRTKKEVIKAQCSAAEAQVKISEAATGVGDTFQDVGMAIQRAEEKTEEMRARAQAVEELEAAGTFDDLTALGSGDSIDRELAQVTGDANVESELARLKAELGPGSTEEAPALEESKEQQQQQS